MGCGKFCAAYCGAMCFVGIFWNIVMGILDILRSEYLYVKEDNRKTTYVGCFIAAAICVVACIVCCVIAELGCGRKKYLWLMAASRTDALAMRTLNQSIRTHKLMALSRERFRRFHDEEEEHQEEEPRPRSDADLPALR